MIPLRKALGSTLGRKVLMSVSGLALVGFVAVHLAENLTLLTGNPDTYNAYVKLLHDLGPLLYVAEAGLAAFFLIHIYMAIRVTLENKIARPQGYASTRTKGGPSMGSPASRGMIWTGLTLLAFLIIHLKSFKYGPDVAEGYTTQIGGQEARDLYRLVIERFQDPLYVGFYVLCMGILGFHLRHGFWSAFQSLGALAPEYRRLFQALGLLIGVLLAVGFILIPIWIYFDLGGALR